MCTWFVVMPTLAGHHGRCHGSTRARNAYGTSHAFPGRIGSCPMWRGRDASVRQEAGGIVCCQHPATALSPRDRGAIEPSTGHFSRKTRRPSGIVFLTAERSCSRCQHPPMGGGIVRLSRTRPPRAGAHRRGGSHDRLPCPCLDRRILWTILNTACPPWPEWERSCDPVLRARRYPTL